MDFQRHQERLRVEDEHGIDNHRRQWMGYAGGEIRTLNPSRGLVFETSAYTVPPHRLAVDYGPYLIASLLQCQ